MGKAQSTISLSAVPQSGFYCVPYLSDFLVYYSDALLRHSFGLLQLCIRKNDCAIELAEKNFSKDLCPSTTKKLAVEAVCS